MRLDSKTLLLPRFNIHFYAMVVLIVKIDGKDDVESNNLNAYENHVLKNIYTLLYLARMKVF